MCRIHRAAIFILTTPCIQAQELTFFPGAGYTASAYEPLQSRLDGLQAGGEVCIAHSEDGSASMLTTISTTKGRCAGGAVFLGATPPLDKLTPHALVITGSRDGVNRFASFAALRHRFRSSPHSFAAVRGASHHSFAAATVALPSRGLDLRPSVSAAAVADEVASIVADFVQPPKSRTGALARAERAAGQLATPIVEALQLEGSEALGVEWCNSDFPTNPKAALRPAPPWHRAPAWHRAAPGTEQRLPIQSKPCTITVKPTPAHWLSARPSQSPFTRHLTPPYGCPLHAVQLPKVPRLLPTIWACARAVTSPSVRLRVRLSLGGAVCEPHCGRYLPLLP